MLALDLFVNGLIFGLFYALMAVGLAMIFGVLKVVNFAHGEFYMIGAYTYVLAAMKLNISPWPYPCQSAKPTRTSRRSTALTSVFAACSP